ncbi:hypothetical protein HispidOSU_025975 [Sigmodon hispidus]
MPGVNEIPSPTAGAQCERSQAKVKAIRATLTRDRESQEFLPAGKVRASEREVRNLRPLVRSRPLSRGRRSGHTCPGVTGPLDLPGCEEPRGTSPSGGGCARGARPRRSQQEPNAAPHSNLPADTSFRLLTDRARGSGSPAYSLDVTDATPSDS